MARLSLDELRGVLVTAVDAGFERAAERAAEAVSSRPDATPADRWEAFGVLEDRAASSVRKLEIIAELRRLAPVLKANDGMLDVAELRVRMQRGDEADVMRLLKHVRREHARDQQVLQAFAEVMMEAGVDLSALAGRSSPGTAAMGAPGGAASSPGTAPAAAAGKLWTPGGESSGPAGEKKVERFGWTFAPGDRLAAAARVEAGRVRRTGDAPGSRARRARPRSRGAESAGGRGGGDQRPPGGDRGRGLAW